MPLILDGNGDITGLAAGALPSNVIGAGAVLQVVTATSTTRVNTNSTSYVAVGASASITPSSATSKIAVFVSSNCNTNNNSGHQAFYTLYRNSTNLGNATTGFGFVAGLGSMAVSGSVAISYVDSPGTTSSVTYSLYGRSTDSGTTVEFPGASNVVHSIVLMEIAA
jgi:hypothetical protein